jgi:hypothetical protein
LRRSNGRPNSVSSNESSSSAPQSTVDSSVTRPGCVICTGRPSLLSNVVRSASCRRDSAATAARSAGTSSSPVRRSAMPLL